MEKIKQAYEVYVGKLDKAFMSYDWKSKDAYALYLAQTYRYIVHSTKLLAFAADNARTTELQACLKHHVSEEMGHEHWVMGDLKRLGYKIEDFPENPETKVLYEQIYEGIKSQGPAAIVGYALALEGMSARVCPKLAPTLIELYGPKCSTFIKNHGEIDPGHAQESFDILKYFSEGEQAVIVDYIELSANAYLAFLQQISRKKNKVAKNAA